MLKLPITTQALETLAQCSSPRFRESPHLSAALEKLSGIDDLKRADIPTLGEVLKLLKATKESVVNDRIVERECRTSNTLIDEWNEILSALNDPEHRFHNPSLASQLTATHGATFNDLQRLTEKLKATYENTRNDLDGIAASRVLLGAVSQVALLQAGEALQNTKYLFELHQNRVIREDQLKQIAYLFDKHVLQLECKFLHCFEDRSYGKTGHPRAEGSIYVIAEGQVWKVDFSVATGVKGKPWPKGHYPGEERYLSGLAELNEKLSELLGRGLEPTDCRSLKRVYNDDLPHDLLMKALLES